MSTGSPDKKSSALFNKPTSGIWPDLPETLKGRADREVLFGVAPSLAKQTSQSRAFKALSIPKLEQSPEDQFFTQVMEKVGHLVGGSDQALEAFYDAVVKSFDAGISIDELANHVIKRKTANK